MDCPSQAARNGRPLCVIDGNRGIILDRAARYPFMLWEEIPKRLGGDNPENLQVAEVREHVTVTKKKKRKTIKKRSRDDSM